MGINTSAQLTKLTALNGMASYIGIPPLQSLSDISVSPDFQLAEQILDELTNEVCAHGMPCNTDYKYTLTPDTETGNIVIPQGAISFFPDTPNNGYYVERDGKLYDLDKQTFEFTSDVKGTVFWLYDYESLPQVARKYVYVEASHRYVARVKGNTSVLELTQIDRRRADEEFMQYTQNIGNANMIYGNSETFYAIDNNSPNTGDNYYQY